MKIKNTIKTTLFTAVVMLFTANVVKSQGCMEASSDEGVSIKGYIQPQWEWYQTGEDTDPTNTFSFNRARIAAIGNIPYDVSYFLMVDFSTFKGGPELVDAFVTYSRFDFAKITFGQFKSPISLEQNTPCQGLHTIFRSRVVNELAGPQRDLGAMVFGGFMDNKINYYLAYMNDYQQNYADDNTGKSIKGRLTIAPWEFIQVGGSFSYGQTQNDSDVEEEKNIKTRFGGELQVKYANFLLEGEYIWGDDTGPYTTGGGCDGTPIEFHTGGVTRSGFFAQAMYKFNFNLQPVVKFESYDPDMDIDSNSETIITYGVNYFLNDWTRIQLNYRYKAEQLYEIPNDQIIVQVQVKF